MDEKSEIDELDQKLGQLFGEEGEGVEIAEDQSVHEDSALGELKALVLWIDWEITSEIMDRFVAQVEKLKSERKHDKVVSVFLQLLESLGKYIRKYKGEAHQDSITLLKSLYNGLEKVSLSSDLSLGQRKKILSKEVKKFKRFKEEIAQGKLRKGEERAPPPPEQPVSEAPSRPEAAMAGRGDLDSGGKDKVEPRGRDPYEIFAYALDELKEVIRDEFRALREELNSLVKGDRDRW